MVKIVSELRRRDAAPPANTKHWRFFLFPFKTLFHLKIFNGIQVQIKQRASKRYKGLKAENPQISLHEKTRLL